MILQLDQHAHKPLHAKALKSFVDFNETPAAHGHPLSPSINGRAAANAIEESRSKIAKLLGAKSANQIFFTNGCTHACEWSLGILNNIIAKTDWRAPWMSPTEHPAIKQAANNKFKLIAQIPINKNGIIYLEEDTFPNDARVICIYVQNEIGIIQPIEQIKCNYLLSDMSQAAGKINIDLSSLDNVNCAIFAAHKFAGPSSIGFFYLKDTSDWEEFGTGSRYFMDRPGTPDTASIVATAVALEEAIKTLEERHERATVFQQIIEAGIKSSGLLSILRAFINGLAPA